MKIARASMICKQLIESARDACIVARGCIADTPGPSLEADFDSLGDPLAIDTEKEK